MEIIIALVIIAAVGLYFVNKSQSNSQENTQDTPADIPQDTLPDTTNSLSRHTIGNTREK